MGLIETVYTKLSGAGSAFFSRKQSSAGIHIDSSFMGATKQLPYLLHALREELPNVEVKVHCYDHHGHENGCDALERDMCRIDPTLASYVKFATSPKKEDAKIAFALRLPDVYYSQDIEKGWVAGNYLNLFVEPLKFERRPKLPDQALTGLREKYGIWPKSRVILAGAIHIDELDSVCEAIDYAKEQNKECETVGIIVPRTSPEVWARVMTNEGVRFDIDAKIVKNGYRTKDKILITQNGLLQELYGICDVAFIGDTLWNTGKTAGQNPLEPAFYGKKSVCGTEHTWNGVAYRGLKNSGLLVEVDCQLRLNQELAQDFTPFELEKRVAAADAFIDSQQGAAKRYASAIREYYEGLRR